MFSLGVEPVDDDIIKKKPRSVQTAMVDTQLIIQMVSAASFMVLGTLFIFWREVRFSELETHCACFVLFQNCLLYCAFSYQRSISIPPKNVRKPMVF